jgi:hypothetical protein
VALVVGATAAIAVAISLTTDLSRGISYTREDDPAVLEWVRLQGISQMLTIVGPPLGIAAGLAVVALLLVLARRWDARFAYYRAVESE